ncbi:MAG TPA: RDD family protein [Pseudobacteroides sp.]|uniref:RDD family protein n=1 Tax=Pseudobacteroides sp. TaxID=1968840 RepID=UPI002F930854
MRRIKDVITPENVFIDFELAGLGSRLLAFLTDFIIQCLAIIVVIIIIYSSGTSIYEGGEIDSYIIAISIVLIFAIYNGYFIFFELILNGQSPGKRLLNLMVIKETGEAITFFDSALRNILRVIDFLPSFYLTGAFIMVFNKNYKRIGDIAANTIVIKNKKNERPLTANDILAGCNFSINHSGANIYPVSEYEFGILKEFMERKEELGGKKSLFAYHLNKYFHSKFNIEINDKNPYEFFEEIIRMNKDIK